MVTNQTLHKRVKTTDDILSLHIFDISAADSSLTIAAFNDENFNIFSNPTQDYLSVTYKNKLDVEVQMHDINGDNFLNDQLVDYKQKSIFQTTTTVLIS